MGPAPLPPHERPWRHPSELAPAAPVDEGSDRSVMRVIALAGGTTVAVIALVLVATINTDRAPSPFAVTASTMPMATIELQRDVAALAGGADDDEPQRVLRSASSSMTKSSAVALAGAPNAISAGPVADNDTDALDLARELPAADDVVLVLTRSHTFRLTWNEIDSVLAPNGSIVVTPDGGLVAVFVSGELRLLVDA